MPPPSDWEFSERLRMPPELGLQLEPSRTLGISSQGAPSSWDKECLPHPWNLKALHRAWLQGYGFRNRE